MSTHPGWKRTTQVKLIAELQGFWAEDLWDMHHSPAGMLSPNASQRRLRFDCKSAAINGELKYVCWKKFSGGEWRGTQELTKVHLMIRWLNSLNDLPASLMSLSFSEWQALYRKYLMGLGMYKPGTTNRMNGNQQPSITARDSGYISLLRQASIMLAQAYDLRPAHEKDIWDLKLMGATTNLSRTNVRLGFLIIRQEWLRDAAKLYLKYCLPLYSASTCRTRVQSLACFSNFLAEVKPQATAKDITRRLLLDYLNYLQKRVRPGCAKNNVLNLRNFLEMSHREAWLTGLQTTGAGGLGGKELGVWRSGNRYALPTSPHPRLRLSIDKDSCATLTTELVQKIGQTTSMFPVLPSAPESVVYDDHHSLFEQRIYSFYCRAVRSGSNDGQPLRRDPAVSSGHFELLA
jgi:hypothetical protein